MDASRPVSTGSMRPYKAFILPSWGCSSCLHAERGFRHFGREMHHQGRTEPASSRADGARFLGFLSPAEELGTQCQDTVIPSCLTCKSGQRAPSKEGQCWWGSGRALPCDSARALHNTRSALILSSKRSWNQQRQNHSSHTRSRDICSKAVSLFDLARSS